MSHNRLLRTFERSATAFAIVIAFPVGTAVPDSGSDTTRKDCPSGAAPKVSHNRPVRMFDSLAVAAGFPVGTAVPDSGSDTTRKDCPSGAAPKVSHNRLVRMSERLTRHIPRYPPNPSSAVLLLTGRTVGL